MSFGEIIYKYLYQPTLPLRYKLNHFKFKGLIDHTLGERQMKKAALQLPPIDMKLGQPSLKINFLTGNNYWHQTIFCIQSLVNQIGNDLSVSIYSDGTLDSKNSGYLHTYCPNIDIVPEQKVLETIEQIIPAEKFPKLHFLRNWSPFFKRMIDIHCQPGWSLHLDSDMLFFKNPVELLSLSHKKAAYYMMESDDNSFLVDDTETLFSKYSIELIKGVNGGIIAYDSDAIDYDLLEYYAKVLLENHFNAGPWRIEQTLMSYILASQNGVGLNMNDYKIHYDLSIGNNDETLRHYIFKAKLPYFKSEWIKILH